MKCQYCDNTFGNKNILNNHQRTAKYCLKLREEKPPTVYSCKGCGKSFSQKCNLDRHTEKCNTADTLSGLRQEILLKNQLIETQKETIQKLEDRINDLEDKLENIAISAVSRPTSITTNNTHNQNQNNLLMNLTPFDMNKEKFAEKINEHFDKNYLINGQKGVAKFAVENILKDEEGKLMYICTDPSRQIYRFKGTDGFIERDVKAKKLTNALYDQIRSKSHSISSEEMEGNDSDTFLLYSGRFQDIKELEDDNSEFSVELSILTSK